MASFDPHSALLASWTVLLASCNAGPASLRERQAGTEGGEAEAQAAVAAAEAPPLEPTSWLERLDEAIYGTSDGQQAGARLEPLPEHARNFGPGSAGPGSPGPISPAGLGSPATLASASGGQAGAGGEDPRQAGGRTLRAIVEGRLAEAVPLAEAWREAAPAAARWVPERVLADLFLALHQHAAAASLYRDLIAGGRHPGDPALHGNLAVACYRLGLARDARQAAEAALRLDSRFAPAVKTLGLVALQEGTRGEAVKLLEAALRLDPGLPEAQVALAEIDEKAGDLESALGRYEKLRALLARAAPLDPYRRWRDLFYPLPREAAVELGARIDAIKAAVATSPPPSPKGEQEP